MHLSSGSLVGDKTSWPCASARLVQNDPPSVLLTQISVLPTQISVQPRRYPTLSPTLSESILPYSTLSELSDAIRRYLMLFRRHSDAIPTLFVLIWAGTLGSGGATKLN